MLRRDCKEDVCCSISWRICVSIARISDTRLVRNNVATSVVTDIVRGNVDASFDIAENGSTLTKVGETTEKMESLQMVQMIAESWTLVSSS